MKNKFIWQLLFMAMVAGLVSFFVSARVSEASFWKDFLDKYLPKIELKKETPITEEIKGDDVAKNIPPYESENSHEAAVIRVVEEAAPAVVSVIVSKYVPIIEQCSYDPLMDLPSEIRQFFSDGLNFSRPCKKGMRNQDIGGGTGFIVSEDGLVITNKHVVSDEEADYTVLTNDGKKYKAKVLARDPIQDLAVLKIEVTGIQPLKLGNSDGIRIGQTAIIIGNALGEFRNTVSVGVISGLSRKIAASDQRGGLEILDELIQTDAAINLGNSGGPLLNLKGEVIGISTAIASGAQSIGFAIPINKAKRDISSVETNGKITIPYLGVRYLSLDEELAAKEKLSVTQGALVRGGEDGAGVVKDSPAYKAGIQAEDIILSINGQKVDEDHLLGSLIQKYQVGDTVKLKLLRDEKELEIPVVLEERKF
ncbi:MAG TPA: trypsin-like peptidase domain-containing protein [Candidatus Paceibacterota bacterium]